jgi:Fic family protein
MLGAALDKARFREKHAGGFQRPTAHRHRSLARRVRGELTSSRWASLAKCSQGTALRDIEDMIRRGVLTEDAVGGRSSSYSLAPIEA